ncbi:hypothetical protein PR048_018637 [Dryococelus australis]|uniref:Vitellogenin n=1 Tax=Dryococelus australis TaxID=614101 RepID=A0ABQ9HD07_9NEOP|nr:hypothetical protein PR048_018637 [Dryococelus australis]
MERGIEVVKTSTPKVQVHVNFTTYYAMLYTGTSKSSVASIIITNQKVQTDTEKLTIVGATQLTDVPKYKYRLVENVLEVTQTRHFEIKL